MRKINFISFIILFLSSLSLHAQVTNVVASLNNSKAVIHLHLSDISPDEILKSLSENQTAEITFELRLYKKTEKFGLSPAILTKEISSVQSGRWIPVTEQYTISTGDKTFYYKKSEPFLISFLSEEFTFTLPESSKATYYCVTRIRLIPLKFMAPFNLLEPFFRNYSRTSPWTRVELTG